MIYRITSVGIGVVTQAGLVQSGGDLRIRFDEGHIASIDLNGKQYHADRYGVVTVPSRDLMPLNHVTAYTSGKDEKAIVLEDFAFDARDSVVSPAWGREIVSLVMVAASTRDTIKTLKSRILDLEKAIKPADNDLCI